jgi:hypothetical protein
MTSCGMMYLTSFMEVGTGVRSVLMFYRNNLNGCNVGITDKGDL